MTHTDNDTSTIEFGFASFADGSYELIVRNSDGDETLLEGQLRPGQLEHVDRILPTCAYVPAVANRAVTAPSEVLDCLKETITFLTDPEIPFPPALHDRITNAIFQIERSSPLAPSEEELRAALKELADASEHDMHLNQGGDNHDDEPEGSGGWWSTRTDNAIRKARAVLATPYSPDSANALTVSERSALGALLELASTVHFAMDDSEEREGETVLTTESAIAMCDALEKLDALPDDQPGYTMSPNAKASWALRRLTSGSGTEEEER